MNINKYKEHQGVLLKPRATQEKPQDNVDTVEKYKQRLAALSAISSLITQSLEIRHALTLVTKKVVELMNIDAIRVYLPMVRKHHWR